MENVAPDTARPRKPPTLLSKFLVACVSTLLLHYMEPAN